MYDGRDIIRQEVGTAISDHEESWHQFIELRFKEIYERLMKLEGGAVVAGEGVATAAENVVKDVGKAAGIAAEVAGNVAVGIVEAPEAIGGALIEGAAIIP